MWKTILAGATALAIAGTTLAYAQKGSDEFQRVCTAPAPNAEDITAFGEARIAALHAGLKLTAEQEKNWPAVESALRDLAEQHARSVTPRVPARSPEDPIERLDLRAEVMGQRAAGLELADAAGPLYKSLDDSRKHRFVALARLGAQEAGGFRGHHGFGGWHHRGPRGRQGGDALPQ